MSGEDYVILCLLAKHPDVIIEAVERSGIFRKSQRLTDTFKGRMSGLYGQAVGPQRLVADVKYYNRCAELLSRDAMFRLAACAFTKGEDSDDDVFARWAPLVLRDLPQAEPVYECPPAAPISSHDDGVDVHLNDCDSDDEPFQLKISCLRPFSRAMVVASTRSLSSSSSSLVSATVSTVRFRPVRLRRDLSNMLLLRINQRYLRNELRHRETALRLSSRLPTTLWPDSRDSALLASPLRCHSRRSTRFLRPLELLVSQSTLLRALPKRSAMMVTMRTILSQPTTSPPLRAAKASQAQPSSPSPASSTPPAVAATFTPMSVLPTSRAGRRRSAARGTTATTASSASLATIMLRVSRSIV